MTIETDPTVWLGYLIFTGLLFLIWRWAGTAIPPASMIDSALIGNHVAQSKHPTSPAAGHAGSDVEYRETVRIASDEFHMGAPFLETVKIRTLVLEMYVSATAILALGALGVARLQAIGETIVAHSYISKSVALALFLLALFLGAMRQLFGCMLSRAVAMPVIDSLGRPKFCFLGDVPPDRWIHSPWFRATTWFLVAGGSLISAWICTLFLIQILNISLVCSFAAFLGLRWLISRLPVLLFFRSA
jgi:hypothetical protein